MMNKKFGSFLFLAVILFLLAGSNVFAQATAGFTLQPSKQTLKAGEELILTVNLETGAGKKINSYIASLKYPEEKLEFVSIDTSASPFNMALQSEGGSGKVTIMRGTPQAQTGKLLIGTVKFKAKAATSAEEVTVLNDSAIISSDNHNILPGSTVQNSSNTKVQTTQEVVGAEKKESGIMGILEWIKNLFASWLE